MQFLVSLFLTGLTLLSAHPAWSRSERGEVGLTFAAEENFARIQPTTSRWPKGTLEQRWGAVGRLGGHLHYGLTDRISVGAGALVSIPIEVATEGGHRAGMPPQAVTLSYRDIVLPVSLAVTAKRMHMLFVQVRLEAGVAHLAWQATSLTLAPQGTTQAQRFALSAPMVAQALVPFGRVGLPVVWRMHDHVSVQWMPYVSLLGHQSWQIGASVEFSALF